MDERCGAGRVLRAEMMAVPAPDTAEDADGCERNDPNQTILPCPCGRMIHAASKRADGGADIAADLEQALRHAVAPARGNPCNARGLGMENRRANANGAGSHKDSRIGGGQPKQHQPEKRKGRCDGSE